MYMHTWIYYVEGNGKDQSNFNERCVRQRHCCLRLRHDHHCHHHSHVACESSVHVPNAWFASRLLSMRGAGRLFRNKMIVTCFWALRCPILNNFTKFIQSRVSRPTKQNKNKNNKKCQMHFDILIGGAGKYSRSVFTYTAGDHHTICLKKYLIGIDHCS